jgi:glutamate dehydrogenase/leucine dehydrogenase
MTEAASSRTLDVEIESFCHALGSGRRAAFVRSAADGRLVPSDASFGAVADDIRSLSDFDEHEAVFFEVGRETGALFAAFLHRTVRGQGAGGVRHWPYASLGDFIRDGLRLSRGMGRKNALAGLYWGGGKGVIARQAGERHKNAEYRTALYREYGAFLTSLRGVYVTAEDVGTTPDDMADIFRTTRFTTCIPASVGGSGNPSFATAKGVVVAIEAAFDHLGAGSLAGKTVAMQGAGNVGASMISDLLERKVSRIVAVDTNRQTCDALSARFAGSPVTIRLVSPDERSIVLESVDVFVPNALGAVLNPDTIPRLRCRVVCGAANNQLLDDRRDDKALKARGISYVPDFVANRMGIVNCANEQYGSLPDDPAISRHFSRDWEHSIYAVTRRILADADARGITSTEAANELADARSLEPHPIFPNRARDIVESLVRERWYEGADRG